MTDIKNYNQLLANINYYAGAESGILSLTLTAAHETISSLITTIESQQKKAPNLHSQETAARYREAMELAEEQLAEEQVYASNLLTERNYAWKEIELKDALIESQKEEIEQKDRFNVELAKQVLGLEKQIESLQKENKQLEVKSNVFSIALDAIECIVTYHPQQYTDDVEGLKEIAENAQNKIFKIFDIQEGENK